ncbi:MAG: hypothetical protein AAFX80_02510 [Cyanobacteria bacterium J06639_18]
MLGAANILSNIGLVYDAFGIKQKLLKYYTRFKKIPCIMASQGSLNSTPVTSYLEQNAW